MKVVAVADTDSYVKWAAALVADRRVDGSLLVLETELAVSDSQLRSAVSGLDVPVRRVPYDRLRRALVGAEVVLVAARGPVARVVARVAGRLSPRPVIVTGLPGISIPPTWLAMHFRRECDLFVLHSHREVREFEALAGERGIDQRFSLASLPFARAHAARAEGTDLVFAAQAIVPRERTERQRIARILVEAAHADRSRRVVLKLRGRPGEHETHREFDTYPDLLAQMGDVPANLVVSYAPMREALATAEGLVTVSSTAAIEAAAWGVPVIALDEFGVAPELINLVFEGSGLLRPSSDVVARRLAHPDAGWLSDNYFHDPSDDTWIRVVQDLVERRARGELPPRDVPRIVGGRAHEAWDRRQALGRNDRSAGGRLAGVVGTPIRAVLGTVRRLRRRLSGSAS
ncbi:DUF6716 putative glycosyltransferase [Microbacterium gubbeenense]|uniref:DUF6716 putative glycosyltransferase n=1 Tax=Microbacterium gubbeenense TaxID=159896 RepID=UPI003F977B2A